MKLLLAGLLCLVLAPLARAEPGVTGANIVAYGIYDAHGESYVRDAQGMLNAEGQYRHRITTTMIPAKQGMSFGFEYKLSGAPAGAVAQIRKVIVFPRGGVRPAGHPVLTRHERFTSSEIGPAQYTGYGFDEAWELVPGKWTIQLWQGRRKLVEKTFDVVAAGPGV